MPSIAQHRVHVGALRQRLGQRLSVEVEQKLPELEVIATRTTPDPVTGTLTIESIERGVSVTGYLDVEWIADCRRCLEPVVGVEHTFVDEIFQVGAEAGGDLIPFDGDTVVLDQVIHD
ncbi:MAG: YceD family protein, partial [Acidimicrobiia bacterium]